MMDMRLWKYSVASFALACSASAATLSFDGSDPAAVKKEGVDTVKGMSGNAVHLGKDSWLEFSSSLPGFMTPTAGTFMAWFKYDDTFPSAYDFRDRDMSEDWKLQWIPNSGFFQRRLFASGGQSISAGISIEGRPFAGSQKPCYCGRRILGGEWHFIAVSYDCSKKEIVWTLDGVLLIKDKLPDGYKVRFAKTFTLGCGGGKAGLEGSIDEVTILPVALSEEAMKSEFFKVQPIRYELQDWSVGEGETKKFRFRARNESAAKVERKIKFSNGAVVSLSLAPNELKDFAVEVKGGKPGLFKLWLNEGEPDARQFECICLAKEKASNPTGKMTLIGEYDCTREYPSDRVALCASEVVTNGNLVYRESREGGRAAPMALYRFRIKHQGRPHMVEVDYPDDKVRTFIAAVYPEKWGRMFGVTTDCAGFMTGIDYPLSMEMRTKEFVLWPDSETVSLLLQNYNGDKLRGEHAAAAKVRLYEMDGLPPGPVQGASPKKRSVATWDEDPTIDAGLVAAISWNYKRSDLEFWRIKWQRIIDYMRWHSMDSWVIKVAAYNGDSTGMYVTMPEAALPWDTFEVCGGRCRGWAELGADMLARNGMGFWVRINHRDDTGWFSRLGGGDPSVADKKMDLRNPAVRKAYLRMVAAYRDKYSAYPGFRGVTLNEWLPVYYPGGCAGLEEYARELGSTIREKGGDAEVQIWLSAMLYSQSGTLKLEKWDADAVFREAGVDVAALSKIPGIRVVPCVRPDHSQVRGKLSDEPYFPDSPSWARLVQDCGIDCINVFRQSNLEIWPKMGTWGAAIRGFNKGLWLPAGSNVPFEDNFQSYATPHAAPPYTLDSVASLVADADLQDLQTGWWGFMEMGEHDEWCRFYGQFRKIPRGRYALAKGPNDPVAVRSGAEGHYLVNREPYPVKVEYVVDGKPEKLILRHHEIRFVEGRGANGNVEVVKLTIPTAEKAKHLANLEKLEAGAKAAPNDAALVRAAKEAREAFDSGRIHQFRALFHLGAVRKLMNPGIYEK